MISPYVGMWNNPVRNIDPNGDSWFSDAWDWAFGTEGTQSSPIEPSKPATPGLFGRLFGGGGSSEAPKEDPNIIKLYPVVDGYPSTGLNCSNAVIIDKSKLLKPTPSVGVENAKNVQRLLTHCKTLDWIREMSAWLTLAPIAIDVGLTTEAGSTAIRVATKEMVEDETEEVTKSNLAYGQEMHRQYKAELHDPANGLHKEFRDIPGIRPDFVDFNTNTIYELKPNNPRARRDEMNQLEKYKKLFEERYGGTWNTVLDTY